MEWPPEILADAELAPWVEAADDLCGAEAQVEELLVHVAGRRLAARVATAAGRATLRVLAKPKADDFDEALRAVAATAAAELLPTPLGVSDDGHALLVEWIDGAALASLDGDDYVEGCRRAGGALARLQRCGAVLERTWSIEREVTQLRKYDAPVAQGDVEAAITRSLPAPPDGPLVVAHRDFRPRHVIVGDDRVRFIDADNLALAPAALDVATFLAALTGSAVTGKLNPALAGRASAAFLAGYGAKPPALEPWRRLRLARMAARAEARYGRIEETVPLLAALRAT
jgi:Ser/Thr protein kinase RdoA (MazF antagonist)